MVNQQMAQFQVSPGLLMPCRNSWPEAGLIQKVSLQDLINMMVQERLQRCAHRCQDTVQASHQCLAGPLPLLP